MTTLLLDTHVWIWAAFAPSRLSGAARDAIDDDANDPVVSVASVWEAAIKESTGRLRLPESIDSLVDRTTSAARMRFVPIEVPHVLEAAALPAHHRDPFDRVVVAQTKAEGYTLVTVDEVLRRYGVPILWAAP